MGGGRPTPVQPCFYALRPPHGALNGLRQQEETVGMDGGDYLMHEVHTQANADLGLRAIRWGVWAPPSMTAKPCRGPQAPAYSGVHAPLRNSYQLGLVRPPLFVHISLRIAWLFALGACPSLPKISLHCAANVRNFSNSDSNSVFSQTSEETKVYPSSCEDYP